MKTTEHRKIWCEKHGVDIEFAAEAYANGFEIHHMDGDHSNNDPDNLVMIYYGDHAKLHNMKMFRACVKGRWVTQEELNKYKINKGKEAYEARKAGKLWKEIGGSNKINAAKWYAQHNNLPWPIPFPRKTKQKAAKKEAKKVPTKKTYKEREKRFLAEVSWGICP